MRRKFSGNTASLADLGTVEGIYEGSREVQRDDGGTSHIHAFRPKEGDPVEIWGFGQLDVALSKLGGKYIWARYTGMQQRKTRFGLRDVHTCELEYDDGQPAAPPSTPSGRTRASKS